MRVPLPPQSHVVKRVLPRTLLGRSLLIILIPLVIVLAVAVQIFYGSHLNLVSRRFTASIAGEIAMVVDGLQRFQRPADRDWILRTAFEELDLLARYEAGALLDDGGKPAADDELVGALHDRVGRPFRLEAGPDEQSVRIRVQVPGGVLDVLAPRKRLYTGTLALFLSWVLGSALLLFGIAALFMRNQVRAIRRLADAAEAFGMGRDHGLIKPEGASRGAAGRHRVQPHAGAHPPLPSAAHGNAGGRLARPAHAAHPPAPRAGDAAGGSRAQRRRGGDERRCRGDGTTD